MQDFLEFKGAIIAHTKKYQQWYATDTNKIEMWNLYLEAFPQHIWRVNQVEDSNYDRMFINRFGGLVALVDNKVISVWDFEIPKDSYYYKTVIALRNYVHSKKIVNRALLSPNKIGPITTAGTQMVVGFGDNNTMYNENDCYGLVPNKVYTYRHLQAVFPTHIKSINAAAEKGTNIACFNLFKKFVSLKEVSILRTLELASNNTLRRFSEKALLEKNLDLYRTYHSTPQEKRDNCIWTLIATLNQNTFRFINTLAGTFLTDLDEGIKGEEKAIKEYNLRADPSNYGRATVLRTENSFANAEKKIEELGYANSFEFVPAIMEDIQLSSITYTNDDTKAKPASMFSSTVKAATTTSIDKEKLKEMDIEDFMVHELMKANDLAIYVDNELTPTFTALFKMKKEAKIPLKWGNPFSFTNISGYAGESLITQTVKAKGGVTDAPFRVSLAWNQGARDNSDLDLHMKFDGHNEIYHGNQTSGGGKLDVDIRYPQGKLAVENIYFYAVPKNNEYKVYVNNYEDRGSVGFELEVKLGSSEIRRFTYDEHVRGKVHCFTVVVQDGNYAIKNINIGIKETFTNNTSKKQAVWGVGLNSFHPVNLVCTTPNHWGESNVGVREYFFVLPDAQPDKELRPFHSSNLCAELHPYRKEIDYLGDTRKVAPAPNQIAGVVLDSTVKRTVVVRYTKNDKTSVVKLRL